MFSQSTQLRAAVSHHRYEHCGTDIASDVAFAEKQGEQGFDRKEHCNSKALAHDTFQVHVPSVNSCETGTPPSPGRHNSFLHLTSQFYDNFDGPCPTPSTWTTANCRPTIFWAKTSLPRRPHLSENKYTSEGRYHEACCTSVCSEHENLANISYTSQLKPGKAT